MPGDPHVGASPARTTPSPGELAANCTVSFEESRLFVMVVYSAVCVLGLPANCVTAWLALQQARRGNVLAVYLFCLALCELLYASTLPLWVLYVQNNHRWALGLGACGATAYIFFCNLYLSILFLCCVSCDRFVAVVYALESRGHRRRRTAVLVSASVFLLVGLVHYPVFEMEMGPKDTCFETVPMDSRVAGYYYSRFAVGFALPLAIVGFTNLRILQSIGRSQGLGATQKARARRTAIAVVVIFLACFAPYHLVLLIKAAAFSYYGGEAGPVCSFEVRLCTVSVVFLCLATVNSVADPVIYLLATDYSWQEASRIYGRWRKGCTRIEATKLTLSKDWEEARPPTMLMDDCQPPGSVQPPGLQLGAGCSLGTLERLSEEPC